MSSSEDRARETVVANGAAEQGENRVFALDPGEGEAWWWMDGLATIKATSEQTDEAEMGRLMAIATKYGGEMLGPPPSR
jgi:hypothetical protein